MIKVGDLVSASFEVYRRLGHHTVDGWMAREVLEVIRVLDDAQRSKGVSGAIAEIGVHHGRFFIGLLLLQRQGEVSVAIDLFSGQERNFDNSGKGNLRKFRKNVRRWSSLDSVVIYEGDSTQLTETTLRAIAQAPIRLFSVDGGHTDPIVFNDMNLAEKALVDGGIVVADDVFNQEWPGVSTGTIRYMSEGGNLVPFAIGFNKVFFATSDYVRLYQGALYGTFSNRYLTFVKSTNYANYEVLFVGRVARRPRKLLGRNEFAKRVYNHVQERRHHRQK
ncbi:class I SAM-dependent methyltransferase [Mycobacterium hodleri]|uniref:Class I SAM-dependent methyltransferase n=1 Tax=Mycolicibacterium hodleri TaxID=49897 RepID=A0A544VZE4_9MYCO|nr:class I SAM-dependent methyltransferase [Mycolicibacterium hodleri]TQR85363.1 class I SAM-dependent methyltransferase [Mycolicibacterium hodleri]